MNETNPVAAFAAVLSIFLSERIATAVAPHLAVLIAGMAGAYFGLSAWRKCTRFEAAVYIVGFGCWAWFLSAMAASVLQEAGQHSPYLPQLCAAAIGWLGHRVDTLLQRFLPGGSPQ